MASQQFSFLSGARDRRHKGTKAKTSKLETYFT